MEAFIYDPIKNVSTNKFSIGISQQFIWTARFIIRGIVQANGKKESTKFCMEYIQLKHVSKREERAAVSKSTFKVSRFSGMHNERTIQHFNI